MVRRKDWDWKVQKEQERKEEIDSFSTRPQSLDVIAVTFTAVALSHVCAVTLS